MLHSKLIFANTSIYNVNFLYLLIYFAVSSTREVTTHSLNMRTILVLLPLVALCALANADDNGVCPPNARASFKKQPRTIWIGVSHKHSNIIVPNFDRYVILQRNEIRVLWRNKIANKECLQAMRYLLPFCNFVMVLLIIFPGL